MFGKNLALLSALCLAAVPSVAAAEEPNAAPEASTTQDRAAPAASQVNIKRDGLTQRESDTGGQSYGDRNRGGRSGFYSYPRHRSVDGGGSGALDRGGGGGGLDRRPFSSTSAGTSPYCGNCHGSAYYGRDYGAPYFGGGYYDRGVYYRERRD